MREDSGRPVASSEGGSVRKTPFLSHFYAKKRSICQDRLGTNIEKKGGVLCRKQRMEERRQGRKVLIHHGKETRLFEPFIYKNAHFTKTGSGQT